MSIRMRESKNEQSSCHVCGIPWTHTQVLFETQIAKQRIILCKRCQGELFQKLLAMECKYNHRIKNVQELKRGARESDWREKHGQKKNI